MNATRLKVTAKRLLSFLRRHDSTEGMLVAIFFLLFFASAMFLTWKISHDLDPDTGKNWWVVAFEFPKDASAVFFIENHSSSSSFSYTVSSNGKTIEDRAISVPLGETALIRPVETPDSKKILITVTRDGTDEKKNIYKNLP